MRKADGRFDGVGMDAVLRVRLTSSEKSELVESAEHAGLTVSEYVRRRAIGHAVISRTDAALIRELRRQGGLIKHVWLATGKVSNDALRAISIISSAIKNLANGG